MAAYIIDRQLRPAAAGVAGPTMPVPRFNWFVLVAIAATVAVPVMARGRLLLIHLCLGAIAPVLVGTAIRQRFLRKLWLAAALWSLAQLVTDYVDGTKLLSQWALTGPLTALLVTGLYWLYEQQYRVSHLLLAVGAGWVALEFVSGVGHSPNPWKYGLARCVSISCLALAYSLRCKTAGIVWVLLVLAGVSLLFDSRLYMGCALITAFVILGGWRLRPRHMAIAAVLAVATLFLAYPTIARAGLVGPRAQAEQQLYDASRSNFLLASRLEFLQALSLAADRRLVGVGSSAELTTNDAEAALAFVSAHGRPLDINDRTYLLGRDSGELGYADHSFALDTVVHGGWFALAFWAFFYHEWFIGLTRRLGRSPAHTPAIFLFSGLIAGWDSLFSPLEPGTVLVMSVVLFLLVVAGGASPRPANDEKRRRGHLISGRESRQTRPPTASLSTAAAGGLFR